MSEVRPLFDGRGRHDKDAISTTGSCHVGEGTLVKYGAAADSKQKPDAHDSRVHLGPLPFARNSRLTQHTAGLPNPDRTGHAGNGSDTRQIQKIV
jgi:hypothetical protein